MTTRRFHEGTERRIDLYRRAFDIAVSAGLLLVVLPVILAAAVGSAISLRAWPFFTQDRVGHDGQLFRFVKVRTLPVDMPGYVDKHQLEVDRIPAFCRFLRRLHLDELPQLLLVLRGRMSLVGPRPEMACLHDRMTPEFSTLRTSVRPGCTGLWQVSEACTGLISAAPEYDQTYLARRSLRLDVWILAQTTRKMLGMGRAITLDALPAWAVSNAEVIDLGDHSEGSSDLGLPVAVGR